MQKSTNAENSLSEAVRAERRKKLAAIEIAFAQIDKQFGKGSVMLLGKRPSVKTETISTGSIMIDAAIGVGGLPRGRIIEVFGPESSGKTTLTLHAIAQAQRSGGLCAFIDAEHAMDPEYARKIGVNVDELVISQPDYGEQALEIAEMLIRSGAIDILVVDSVAALVPKSELDGEMGDQHVGLQARLMSQALRKLTPIVHRSRTVLIFINQIRSTIGGMAFANKETTTGGKALKFYSSIRLDVRKIATIKKSDKACGNRLRVKVAKNKVAPPFKTAEVDLIFGVGISKELDLIEAGLHLGILKQAGSWFSYNSKKIAQGRDNCARLLASNPDLYEKIRSDIYGKMSSWEKSL
jgi:recombination protein RecA